MRIVGCVTLTCFTGGAVHRRDGGCEGADDD